MRNDVVRREPEGGRVPIEWMSDGIYPSARSNGGMLVAMSCVRRAVAPSGLPRATLAVRIVMGLGCVARSLLQAWGLRNPKPTNQASA